MKLYIFQLVLFTEPLYIQSSQDLQNIQENQDIQGSQVQLQTSQSNQGPGYILQLVLGTETLDIQSSQDIQNIQEIQDIQGSQVQLQISQSNYRPEYNYNILDLFLPLDSFRPHTNPSGALKELNMLMGPSWVDRGPV